MSLKRKMTPAKIEAFQNWRTWFLQKVSKRKWNHYYTKAIK
jgi:hypothetical protein